MLRNLFQSKLIILILIILLGWAGWMFIKQKLNLQPPAVVGNLSLSKTIDSEKGPRYLEGNWLRHSESGLWELYLHGKDIDRGTAYGKLADSLMYVQEKAFVNQIYELVPSTSYLKFLKYFIAFFNRNIEQHITPELQNEIYGTSLSCSDEFAFIGSAYQRQLNYHAAHDIGHALQGMNMVACSSFAAWDDKTTDSTLIIGRNFDFYVGDEFARNKLVMFVQPDSGYAFVSISWGGMSGVVSGMNRAGLTITLNAAKSSIPTGAATPISLLAREILQYAANIDEAYAIAKKRQVFVSESLLIGSASDGRAAIIEKTPETIGLYAPKDNQLICTNHYQSDELAQTPSNLENIRTSDSEYRYQRLSKLVNRNKIIDPQVAASILRNQQGINDQSIGMGNEKAINQLIAHHSVIMHPASRTIWVSQPPYQLGQYIAYQLDSVFNRDSLQANSEIYCKSLTIPADTFLNSRAYRNFETFRTLRTLIRKATKAQIRIATCYTDWFSRLNPDYFQTYQLLGDYYTSVGNKPQSVLMYRKALTCEIPRVSERQALKEALARQLE